jgi:hypothetical protein
MVVKKEMEVPILDSIKGSGLQRLVCMHQAGGDGGTEWDLSGSGRLLA